MKHNVIIKEIKFQVNEKKKVVTAIAFFKFQSLAEIHNLAPRGESVNMVHETPTKPVVALAICSEGDTFDIEFGKKLAEAKVRKACYHKAGIIYRTLEMEHLAQANKLSVGFENCVKAAKGKATHLQHLLSELEER